MTQSRVIPLFPLGSVLVPGLVFPLHIFEPRYRQMVDDLTVLPEDDRGFGIIAIREGHEVGTDGVSALFDVGTFASLREVKPATMLAHPPQREGPHDAQDDHEREGDRQRTLGRERPPSYPDGNEPDENARRHTQDGGDAIVGRVALRLESLRIGATIRSDDQGDPRGEGLPDESEQGTEPEGGHEGDGQGDDGTHTQVRHVGPRRALRSP